MALAYFIIILLAVFILVREYFAIKERSELLDRLMARDFTEYVMAPASAAKVPDEVTRGLVRSEVEAMALREAAGGALQDPGT